MEGKLEKGYMEKGQGVKVVELLNLRLLRK